MTRTMRRQSSPSPTKPSTRRKEKGATVRYAPEDWRRPADQLVRTVGPADQRAVNPPAPAGVIADPDPFIGVRVSSEVAAGIRREGNSEIGSGTFANVSFCRRLELDRHCEQRLAGAGLTAIHAEPAAIA